MFIYTGGESDEWVEDALSSADPDDAETYQNNLAVYTEELPDLDTEYQAAADTAAVRTLLFCDRFPFRYLADDYALDYHAAFPGCSAETEAGFETTAFLSDKAEELRLKNVLVLESSDQSLAKTVIENTSDLDRQILFLDSMQSVTEGDVRDGVTYLSIAESNLTVLKKAMQ